MRKTSSRVVCERPQSLTCSRCLWPSICSKRRDMTTLALGTSKVTTPLMLSRTAAPGMSAVAKAEAAA